MTTLAICEDLAASIVIEDVRDIIGKHRSVAEMEKRVLARIGASPVVQDERIVLCDKLLDDLDEYVRRRVRP